MISRKARLLILINMLSLLVGRITGVPMSHMSLAIVLVIMGPGCCLQGFVFQEIIMLPNTIQWIASVGSLNPFSGSYENFTQAFNQTTNLMLKYLPQPNETNLKKPNATVQENYRRTSEEFYNMIKFNWNPIVLFAAYLVELQDILIGSWLLKRILGKRRLAYLKSLIL